MRLLKPKKPMLTKVSSLPLVKPAEVKPPFVNPALVKPAVVNPAFKPDFLAAVLVARLEDADRLLAEVQAFFQFLRLLVGDGILLQLFGGNGVQTPIRPANQDIRAIFICHDSPQLIFKKSQLYRSSSRPKKVLKSG